MVSFTLKGSTATRGVRRNLRVSEAEPSRRNLRVCATKPRACQTVGRHLKIQIRRTKGEALSARWGIGSWQPASPKVGRKKKKGGRVAAEGDAFGKRRLIMGANPPQLDLETRRGSFWNLSLGPRSISFDRKSYGLPTGHDDFN